jgi:hypothetical protein
MHRLAGVRKEEKKIYRHRGHRDEMKIKNKKNEKLKTSAPIFDIGFYFFLFVICTTNGQFLEKILGNKFFMTGSTSASYENPPLAPLY